MTAPRRAAALVVAGVVLLAGCGGDGEAAGPGAASREAADSRQGGSGERNSDTRDGASTTPAEEPEPTPAPTPVPEGELPPIRIESPKPFQTLVGSFVLGGTAQVPEGELAWALLGADLRPLRRGRLSATCGAPCRGRFSTRISLARVPIGSWELHVWSPSGSDDGPARLHDTMVPVTVSDRHVPGAPAPGAPPPGGAPR